MWKRFWHWLLGVSDTAYGRGIRDGKRDRPTDKDMTVRKGHTASNPESTPASDPQQVTYSDYEESLVQAAEHDIHDRLELWGKDRESLESRATPIRERLNHIRAKLEARRRQHRDEFGSRDVRLDVAKRTALCIVIALGVPEALVSKSALDVFRLDRTAVWMWAFILTVCVIFVAHWLGRMLKQWHPKLSTPKMMAMACAFFLLLMLTCYALVEMRAEYLAEEVAERGAAPPGFGAYLTIAVLNLLIMSVNMLLSYLSHDESALLEYIVHEIKKLERELASEQARWFAVASAYDLHRSNALHDVAKIQRDTLIKIAQYRDANRHYRANPDTVPSAYKTSIGMSIFVPRPLGSEYDLPPPALSQALTDARAQAAQTPNSPAPSTPETGNAP